MLTVYTVLLAGNKGTVPIIVDESHMCTGREFNVNIGKRKVFESARVQAIDFAKP